MSTTKQKKVAKAIVENLQSSHPETAGQMLEKVGYAKSVATHKPKDILESEGVKEELKILGFDEETAKNVVADILIGAEDDGHRLKAADMVFKTFGTYAPDKHLHGIARQKISDEEAKDIAYKLLELQKNGTYTGENT